MNNLLYKDEIYYFDLIKHKCDKHLFYTFIKEKLPEDWSIKILEIYLQCRPNDFWSSSDELHKCSYDYATGLKGVLNFLERLDNIALGRRFFLDEIIEANKYEKNISEI